MTSELEDELNAMSGALRLGFYGDWDEAKKFLHDNLPHNGFLNASIVFGVLEKLSLELCNTEDQKLLDEYRKKNANE